LGKGSRNSLSLSPSAFRSSETSLTDPASILTQTTYFNILSRPVSSLFLASHCLLILYSIVDQSIETCTFRVVVEVFERSVVEKKRKIGNFTQAGPSLVTCDSDSSPFAKLFQATVAETVH
jgi:hypothetical protein